MFNNKGYISIESIIIVTFCIFAFIFLISFMKPTNDLNEDIMELEKEVTKIEKLKENFDEKENKFYFIE